MTHKSEFVNTLIARGHLYQATDLEGLDAAALASERGGPPLVGYIGFDCTAPSLHVGHLLQIMLLRRLQQCGGKPIALMGGGTTRVGDPSDKNEARPLLTLDTIAANKAEIAKVFSRFLTFGQGRCDAIQPDNADWLAEVRWLDMLRDIGRHFTINKMVGLEFVKRRLDAEQPITFLEFNYMLLQAYDFLELARRYDCSLQMGGSDQWGNIVQGVELCRRAEDRAVFGLTQPLLMSASGQKMGKTAGGAVWLNAEMLSPFDYWQYWRNVDDADVGRLLRVLTDTPLEEIVRLEALQGAEINDAKKLLADETTKLLHGEAAAAAAASAAAASFGAGGDIAGLPRFPISPAQLTGGYLITAALVDVGLAVSKSEAKRLVEQGGVSVNGRVVRNGLEPVTPAFINADGEILWSRGKKRVIQALSPT